MIVVTDDRNVEGEVPIVNAMTEELQEGEQHLYFPVSHLEIAVSRENSSIYFDLESYAFFQKIMDVIQHAREPKGVFRLRRLIEKLDKQAVAADVFVLGKLFGNAKDIFVKEAKGDVQHLIVTINFGNGCMAHLDYTTAKREYVEIEWSGNGQIIEFNTDAMNPFQPQHFTVAPLVYNADVLMKNAHLVDKQLFLKLNALQETITGGDAS